MQASDVLSKLPTNPAGALALFDSLDAVSAESMIGTWRGAEVPTGHPMDGLLAVSGWWGKQFIDAETVHPLLFPTRDGSVLWPMNPALAFGATALTRLPGVRGRSFATPIAMSRRAWQTNEPKARLRTTRYRGVDSATMVYDQLPINDVFRRVSDDIVLGAMDLRGQAPYFFVLRRDDSLSLVSAVRQ